MYVMFENIYGKDGDRNCKTTADNENRIHVRHGVPDVTKYVHNYVCMYMRMQMFMDMSMCMGLFICICMCKCTCTCMTLCMCMFIHASCMYYAYDARLPAKDV